MSSVQILKCFASANAKVDRHGGLLLYHHDASPFKLVDLMIICWLQVRARDYLQHSKAAAQATQRSPASDAMDISSTVQSPAARAAPEPDLHATPSPDAAHRSPAAMAGCNEPDAGAAAQQPAVGERLKAVRTQLAAAAEECDAVRLGRANSSASPASDGSSQPRTQPSSPAFERSLSGSPLTAVQEELPSDLAAAAETHQPTVDAAMDVTIATQAAFAAVNTMFAETMALPRQRQPSVSAPFFAAGDQHGLQGSTGAVQAELQIPGEGTAAAQRSGADITIATRSAFDAVNSMFHGALPHDAPWPSQRGNSLPRRGAGRVSSGGALTAKLIAGRHQPSAPRSSFRCSVAPEPTVTMGTQAAFDALNSMFASQLPHESAGAAAQHAEPVSHGDELTGRGVQAAPAEPALGEAGLDFRVYEDTQVFGRKPQTDASGELAIYEDTQFMRAPSALTARSLAEREGSDFSAAAAPPQESPTGFQLYEDTQFMKENGQGGPGDSLQLYEDTQFIGSAACCAGPGAAPQPAAQQSPGLGIYEETEFRTVGGAQREDSPRHAGTGVLEVYEDTALLQGLQADARLPRQDVTAFMTENVAPPAGHQADQDTGDLLADADVLDVLADQVALSLPSMHAYFAILQSACACKTFQPAAS